MMRIVFIVAALVLPPTYAAPRTWWKSFCEKYLVADDPYQYEPVIEYFKNESANHEEFVTKLVNKYREVGASLSWMRKPDFPESRRIFLRTLGRELRIERGRPDVDEVLDYYSHLENESD